MKVAFASKDGLLVNDHFGWAKEFTVYDIREDQAELVARREVEQFDPDFEPEELDKIEVRIKAISDCAIVMCNNIGAVSAARVIRSKIHPLKVPVNSPIASEIQRLQAALKNPPIWIRKILMEESA